MPTRLLKDASVVLDANGVGSIVFEPVPSWSEFTTSVQCSSSQSAQFTFGIGVYQGPGSRISHKLDFGAGATMVSGPYVLSPLNESLMVSITNGIAGDLVSATAFGVQDIDPGNIDAKSANRSSQTTTIVGSVTGTFTQNQNFITRQAAALNNALFSVPAGVQALFIKLLGNNNANSHFKLVGSTSNFVYWESYAAWPLAIGPLGAAIVIPWDSARDTQVGITWDGANGTAIEVTGLVQGAPEMLEFFQPPWAAPNRPTLLGTAQPPPVINPQTLIASAPNVKIVLFRITAINASAAPANSYVSVKFAYGPSGVSTTDLGTAAVINPLSVVASANAPDVVFGPTTLPGGNAVFMSWTGGGGNMTCAAVYSQF